MLCFYLVIKYIFLLQVQAWAPGEGRVAEQEKRPNKKLPMLPTIRCLVVSVFMVRYEADIMDCGDSTPAMHPQIMSDAYFLPL